MKKFAVLLLFLTACTNTEVPKPNEQYLLLIGDISVSCKEFKVLGICGILKDCTANFQGQSFHTEDIYCASNFQIMKADQQ